MTSQIILNNSFFGGVLSTISSSPSAISVLPCENLLNGMRHKFCRISAGGSATITASLSSSILITAVGVGGFKFSNSATARCVISNAASTVVYDSGTWNLYSHAAQAELPWFSRTKFWFVSSPVSAKTIAVTINDSIANFDISHLVFGQSVTPINNPDWGAGWNWIDTSIQQRTAGGALLINPAFGHRRVQLTWPNLPDTDWNNIAALIQNQGQAVMVSTMPGEGTRREGDLQMIGRLVSADGINLAGYGLNTVASCVFEEI